MGNWKCASSVFKYPPIKDRDINDERTDIVTPCCEVVSRLPTSGHSEAHHKSGGNRVRLGARAPRTGLQAKDKITKVAVCDDGAVPWLVDSLLCCLRVRMIDEL